MAGRTPSTSYYQRLGGTNARAILMRFFVPSFRGTYMAKRTTPFELTLDEKPKQISLTRWLHEQLRQAMLDGRLKSGTRLPASRDFAALYKISRGTVVSVFEQLRSEGFLSSKRGFGTWVNKLPEHTHRARKLLPVVWRLPSPLAGLSFPPPPPPL